MGLEPRPATILVTIIVLGSTALAQLDSERLEMSANELARKVVTNEAAMAKIRAGVTLNVG
jgi:hypothetical protein